MDFSPYKPSPDDDRKRQDRQKGKTKATDYANPSYSPYQAGGSVGGGHGASFQSSPASSSASPSMLEQGGSGGGATLRVNKYETTLPIRVDVEAALTYVVPPLSGLVFLVLETHNDYVRFHAWQSSLYFLALMSVLFLMLFISTFLSWVLFFVGIGSIGYLAYRAYLDGASLERYEMPYFGPMASEWVDTE
ncbi:hypothetical protein BC940DRAFT_295118 [Gongronella butleri]|nr:hypothetical protein BC940DRAFT_295118 [Gongronella butleri]